MKKLTLILLLVCITLSSCYRYGVKMANGAAVAGNNGKLTEKKVAHIIWWGAKTKKFTSGNCPSGGIYEAEVKSTFIQSLITVITLGFYHPITIEYSCTQPNE